MKKELSLFEQEEELQAFGSSGGKSRVSTQIVSMIPTHNTYIEPYAGGAAVFWKKEKVKSVLNDKNAEIAQAYQFIRDHTTEQLNRLKQMDWEPNQKHWKALKDSSIPKDPVQRFYRFFYVQAYSYGLSSKTYGYKKIQTKVYNRFEKLKEELKGTEIYSTDANKVINKYNSKDSFIYLDPPYPEEWAGPEGTKLFSKEDTQDLHDTLKKFKGNWLMSINDLPWIRKMFSDFTVKNFTVPRSFRKGDSPKDELLIYNYDIKKLSESVKDLEVSDSSVSRGSPIESSGLLPTKFPKKKKKGSIKLIDNFVSLIKSENEIDIQLSIDPNIKEHLENSIKLKFRDLLNNENLSTKYNLALIPVENNVIELFEPFKPAGSTESIYVDKIIKGLE